MVDKPDLLLHITGITVAEVYLLRTDDREKGVHRLYEASALDVLGKEVVIKANYNSADPFPASTHRGTLSSLFQELCDQKPSSIALLERSGMGRTQNVLE